MRFADVTIEGVSPVCFGKPFATTKTKDETHADFEKRCWKERAHIDDKGRVYIVPMAFKNSLAEAAKYKATQIPGKGKTTYTKHFEAGVMVLDPLVLGDAEKLIVPFDHFVPSDGRRGGSSRVWKTFPIVRQWGGVVTYLVFDDVITPDVFASTLNDSGSFIGVGSMRPRNNGIFGRFAVTDIKWRKG